MALTCSQDGESLLHSTEILGEERQPFACALLMRMSWCGKLGGSGPQVKEMFSYVTHLHSSLESVFTRVSDLSPGILPLSSVLPHCADPPG